MNGGSGLDAISGSDRPPCRSIMFRASRDASAYRNKEGDSPVAPTDCPPTGARLLRIALHINRIFRESAELIIP
jgi:hypothetical protein